MNRTRDYYRKQRAKHIARKQRMVKEWSMNGNCLYWVAPAGALSKGKIHCSCWMCRRKSYDYKKARDLARIEAMNQSERYYQTNGYEFEDYNFTDVEWNWLQVEENWYYEENYWFQYLDGDFD